MKSALMALVALTALARVHTSLVQLLQIKTSSDHLGSFSGVQFRLVDSNAAECYTIRYKTQDGFDSYTESNFTGAKLGSCETKVFNSMIRDVYVIHDGIDDWSWDYIKVHMDDKSMCSTTFGFAQGATNLPYPCT